LLARGRWLSPGTPASSTTKTGRHDIAEILLKVALKHQKSKSKSKKKSILRTSMIYRFNTINVRISKNSGSQKKYVLIYNKDL
jgi:hypothetical protein